MGSAGTAGFNTRPLQNDLVKCRRLVGDAATRPMTLRSGARRGSAAASHRRPRRVHASALWRRRHPPPPRVSPTRPVCVAVAAPAPAARLRARLGSPRARLARSALQGVSSSRARWTRTCATRTCGKTCTGSGATKEGSKGSWAWAGGDGDRGRVRHGRGLAELAQLAETAAFDRWARTCSTGAPRTYRPEREARGEEDARAASSTPDDVNDDDRRTNEGRTKRRGRTSDGSRATKEFSEPADEDDAASRRWRRRGGFRFRPSAEDGRLESRDEYEHDAYDDEEEYVHSEDLDSYGRRRDIRLRADASSGAGSYPAFWTIAWACATAPTSSLTSSASAPGRRRASSRWRWRGSSTSSRLTRCGFAPRAPGGGAAGAARRRGAWREADRDRQAPAARRRRGSCARR